MMAANSYTNERIRLLELLENIIQVRAGMHAGFTTLQERADEMSRLAAEAILVLPVEDSLDGPNDAAPQGKSTLVKPAMAGSVQPDQLTSGIDGAPAVAAPITPSHEGWKLVPPEPTKAMEDAYLHAETGDCWWDAFCAGYRAMLAAAPDQTCATNERGPNG